MTFQLSTAVVIDDALGPPAAARVSSEDKSAWITEVLESEKLQGQLLELFADLEIANVNELVEKLLSDHDCLVRLWHMFKEGSAADSKLDVLFKTLELEKAAGAEKAKLILEVLTEIIGDPSRVSAFSELSTASTALGTADVAFVDFYLVEGESEDLALERIKNAANILKAPKLLFFMSSRASLETQQAVRKDIGVRSAFFEVLRKPDITVESLKARLNTKVAAYDDNFALEQVINTLISSVKEATQEFEDQTKILEVHDLSLLNIFRLESEGETLPSYLSWLFSESLAAKTRRITGPQTAALAFSASNISFSGQIRPTGTLFNLFSEVVFGEPTPPSHPLRFGEVVQIRSGEVLEYFLVLTPACDLIRCNGSDPILCVRGEPIDCSDPIEQSKAILSGKFADGVRHFLQTAKYFNGKATLITWKPGQIRTFLAKELASENIERVALMGELFAHEVKEEVLRNLGRVGTPIHPPPPFALKAVIRWTTEGNRYEKSIPVDRFIPALLMYSEIEDTSRNRRDKGLLIVCSDEFKHWIVNEIHLSNSMGKLEPKLQACLSTLHTQPQFQLKNSGEFKQNDFCIRVQAALPEESTPAKSLLDITLLTESEV